jgi:hypothetical protein
MLKQEDKYCEKCGVTFHCRQDDITQCQCYNIDLNDGEWAYISAVYKDCICSSCIRELQSAFKAANL